MPHRKLLDSNRRGTMIISPGRTGSHFVHDLARYYAYQQNMNPISHGELRANPTDALDASPADFLERLDRITSDPGYHIVIINQLELKSDLIDHPRQLDDWHVIRVVDHDPHRWFRSWFFYTTMQHSMNSPEQSRERTTLEGHDGEVLVYEDNKQRHFYDAYNLGYLRSFSKARGYFIDDRLLSTRLPEITTGLHHGTPKNIYEQFVATVKDSVSIKTILSHFTYALNNHLVDMIIPVDVEVQYDQLKNLATDEVRWEANDYPIIDIPSLFEHGDLIETIIDRWRVPYHGKFKEKQ